MNHFNPSTGLVYHEQTCPRIPSMLPTWMHESRNKRVDPSQRRDGGRKGSASLGQVALRACVWNADLFLPETLREAGWWFAGRVYGALKDSETLSFYIWTIFHHAFPAETALSYSFRVLEGKDASSSVRLSSVASSLARLDTAILSFICVRSCNVRFEQLVSLAGIPTLAGLVLESPRTCKGELAVEEKARECRAWARAVKEKGALGKLRVLVLCNFGVEREVVLRCVREFPALCLVGLFDSGSGKPQMSYGDWQCVDDNGQNGAPGSNSKLDPNAIWTRRDLTSTGKAESLYDISFDLLPQIGARENPCPTVAVSYGDSTGYVDNPLHWYLRDPRERNVYAHKRPEYSGASTEGEGDGAAKKRRVRQGKQRDIGSMLETFAA